MYDLVHELGFHLRNFKVKQLKPLVTNFSCPLCGDSEKNKNRARGYIIEKGGKFNYYCHNCGSSMSLFNFVKKINPNLWHKFSFELFGTEKEPLVNQQDKENIITIQEFLEKHDKVYPVKCLSSDHIAIQYLKSRKIPEKYFDNFYYTPKYGQIYPEKHNYKVPDIDDPRLISLYLDQNKNLIGIEGRTLSNNKVRYIKAHLNEKMPMIYGLHRVVKSRDIHVFEGVFDSLMVENSISIGGSNISEETLGFFDEIKKNMIFVYDNEPHNKSITRQIERSIDRGFKTCIWPKSILHKDANEMIVSGMSFQQLEKIIRINTFQGLEAKLKFIQWRKIHD